MIAKTVVVGQCQTSTLKQERVEMVIVSPCSPGSGLALSSRPALSLGRLLSPPPPANSHQLLQVAEAALVSRPGFLQAEAPGPGLDGAIAPDSPIAQQIGALAWGAFVTEHATPLCAHLHLGYNEYTAVAHGGLSDSAGAQSGLLIVADLIVPPHRAKIVHSPCPRRATAAQTGGIESWAS